MPPRKRPVKKNPPLSIAETRRRIAAVGEGQGWDIFERGDGEWSIQVDDEFWADTPRDRRVTDDDVAQLPEAQAALADRIDERSPDELTAREAIASAMQMNFSRSGMDIRELADRMITPVARHMASFGTGADWARIARYRNAPDFKQQVYLAARNAGLGAVDDRGRRHSLQRPPAFWEFRGEPERGRVPIFYERPMSLQPLELAIATALDLDIPQITVDPEPSRDFIADVWEVVLVDPATPSEWLAGIVSDPVRLRERVRLAVRRVAEERPDAWVWTTPGRFGGGNVTSRIRKLPPARALGMPPPEEIPEEARGIASAMAAPRPMETSGSPEMQMIGTTGRRGSYPQEITQVVSNFSDTSYGNDTMDSVQFSIGNVGYRLWVNQANESERHRDAGSEFRYSIVELDRPTPTSTLQQVLDEGTPGWETVFETDYPAELIAYLRRRAGQGGIVSGSMRVTPPAHSVRHAEPDMSDVFGNNAAIAAAEQAVANGQNLLLVGGGLAAMIARRIPTIMKNFESAPFRAPHHTISRVALADAQHVNSEVNLAKGGVLFLDDYDQFEPAAIELLAKTLKAMPSNVRPIVVAAVKAMPLPRRHANAIDFQVRADVQPLAGRPMGQPQGETSAAIRARIAAGPPPIIDITAERFKQMELGRSTEMGMSPLFRSTRLKGHLPVGTRVQLLRTVVHGTDVYPKGMAGTVERNDQDRIEIRPDDIAEPGTQYLAYDQDRMEQLAGDLEIEAESAERFRMIEMNPKNNPAWVTSLLSKHFEFLEDKVPAKWLPKLTKAQAKRGKLTAAMKEYGCGSYGCVLPTLDPKVVLKVTTDDTEYQFAAELAADLTAQVTVVYHLVAGLPEKHRGRFTYLLWRDSADRVGELDKVVGEGGGDPELVEHAIDVQHKAAQQVYIALMDGEPAHDLLEKWKAAALAMGKAVPELAELADGMIINLDQNKVFFGDVHSGNLGMVGGRWLVIDPGNIAVLENA